MLKMHLRSTSRDSMSYFFDKWPDFPTVIIQGISFTFGGVGGGPSQCVLVLFAITEKSNSFITSC